MDDNDDIFIIIDPIVGKYYLACDTDKDNLLTEKVLWERRMRDLAISVDDENFVANGTYYCAVSLI